MRHARLPKWFRVTSVATVLVMLFSLMPVAQPAHAAPSIPDQVIKLAEDTGVMDLIEQAQKLLDEAGKFYSLEDFWEDLVSVPGDLVAVGEKTAEDFGEFTALVEDLAVKAGEGLLTGLKAIEGLERVEAPLPGGYLIATRKADQVAFCVYLNGPGDSAATLGLANDDPLCQEGLPRLANPSGNTVAFLDLTRDGSGYLMLQKTLTGEGTWAPPVFEAEDYVTVPGGQTLRISLGSNDNASVSVGATIGVLGSFDYVVTGNAGVTAGISVSVSPNELVGVMEGLSQAIQTELGAPAQATPAPLPIMTPIPLEPMPLPIPGMGQPLAAPALLIPVGELQLGNLNALQPSATEEPQAELDRTVQALLAGLTFLSKYEPSEPGGLGSAGLTVAITGMLGAGIWDTALKGVSGTGTVSLDIPLDQVPKLSASLIMGFIENGMAIADPMLQMASGMVTGNLSDADIDRNAQRLRDSTQKALTESVKQIADALGATVAGTQLSAGVSLDVAGQSKAANNDAGDDGADTTIKAMEASASLPIGQAVLAAPTFVEHIVRGAVAILSQLASDGGIPGAVPADWSKAAEIADSLADGTTFSVKAGLPSVLAELEVPAKPLLQSAAAGVSGVQTLFAALIESAEKGSLAPLKGMDVVNLLNGVLKPVQNDLKFGISIEAGTSHDLGAEAWGTAGAGAQVSLNTNPDMLIGAVTGWKGDSPDATGAVEFEVAVNVSGQAGARVGEVAELQLAGSFSYDTNLLSVSIKEWDEPVPEPMVRPTVAGFKVRRLKATQAADGTVTGEGLLLLPLGGAVHANFTLDKAGRVTRGTWDGTFRVNDWQFTVAKGTLSEQGLNWKEKINVGGAGVDFDLTLAASGSLTGRFNGMLKIGQYTLNNVNLQLTNTGVTGTGYFSLLGSSAKLDLSADAKGGFSGTFQGDLKAGKIPLSQVTLTLTKDGFSGKGTANLGIADVRFSNLTVTPDGKIGGSFSGNLTIGGMAFSSVNLTLADGKVSGKGKVTIADSQVELQLNTNDQGQLYGTFSGTLKVGSVSLGNV